MILLCPVSGRRCTRDCEHSPENPALAGLCERLGFAPMKEREGNRMSRELVTAKDGTVLGTVEAVPVAGSFRGKWAISWVSYSDRGPTSDGEVILPVAAIGPLIEMLAPLAPGYHIIPCDNNGK